MTTDPSKKGSHPVWTFNGNPDNPTISPSILVRWNYADNYFVCHTYIRDGKIQYLNDCTHHLKGQTVELPDVQDFYDGKFDKD